GWPRRSWRRGSCRSWSRRPKKALRALGLLAGFRARYDKHLTQSKRTNRLRDWHNGNHPGYTLACRLEARKDQVWLFTTVLSVPWTNNPAEQALKSPKLQQKVSGTGTPSPPSPDSARSAPTSPAP